MKSKLDLAHDYAIKTIGLDGYKQEFMCHAIENGWRYADEMYKQLEEREKDKQDRTKQEQQNYHDELVSIGLEEWQPDWSQAPDWAIVYTCDQIGGQWWDVYPFDSETMWLAEGIFQCISSPSFDYKGDWKDSLRKRPEGS